MDNNSNNGYGRETIKMTGPHEKEASTWMAADNLDLDIYISLPYPLLHTIDYLFSLEWGDPSNGTNPSLERLSTVQ